MRATYTVCLFLKRHKYFFIWPTSNAQKLQKKYSSFFQLWYSICETVNKYNISTKLMPKIQQSQNLVVSIKMKLQCGFLVLKPSTIFHAEHLEPLPGWRTIALLIISGSMKSSTTCFRSSIYVGLILYRVSQSNCSLSKFDFLPNQSACRKCKDSFRIVSNRATKYVIDYFDLGPRLDPSKWVLV